MPTPAFVARTPALDGEPVLSVETLTRLDQVLHVRDAWLALEQLQSRAVFFQSFAWCTHVWRTRDKLALPCTPAPHIVVVRRGERVVAIWPLAVVQNATGRYAQDLTDPFGQYSDLLVEPREDAEAICDLAARSIASWRIDGIVLRKVRADSASRPWLERRGTLAGDIDAAPEVAIAAVGGHDAYHRSLNAKTRKNLRNYRNRLAREGTIVHTVHDARTEASGIVARCFDGRTGWLESSGLSSTAFADPAFFGIVGDLSRVDRDTPRLVALRLALAPDKNQGVETELSLHWGFEHAGRYYAYMASRNAAFDAFSPGRLHLEDLIEALAARGNDTIDLLMPAIPYKTSVATGSIPVATYGVAFTLRGRLAIDGWHGCLRPALKKAVMALPPGARRGIMAARSMLGGIVRPERDRIGVAATSPSPGP